MVLYSEDEKLILKEYGDSGLDIYLLIDGKRTAEDIMNESGMSKNKLTGILDFLAEQKIINLYSKDSITQSDQDIVESPNISMFESKNERLEQQRSELIEKLVKEASLLIKSDNYDVEKKKKVDMILRTLLPGTGPRTLERIFFWNKTPLKAFTPLNLKVEEAKIRRIRQDLANIIGEDRVIEALEAEKLGKNPREIMDRAVNLMAGLVMEPEKVFAYRVGSLNEIQESLVTEKYGEDGIRVYSIIDNKKTVFEIFREVGIPKVRIAAILDFLDQKKIIRLEYLVVTNQV